MTIQRRSNRRKIAAELEPASTLDRMFIREWYAGQVLPVIGADYLKQPHGVRHAAKSERVTPEQYLARTAFKLADAMVDASREI